MRLDHCFVKPKNEDAEVIEVDVGGEKKQIVMAPGKNNLFLASVMLVKKIFSSNILLAKMIRVRNQVYVFYERNDHLAKILALSRKHQNFDNLHHFFAVGGG